MQVEENKPLLERKLFLIRALEHKNVENVSETEQEIKELEFKIKQNLASLLIKLDNELKNEVVQVKKVVSSDGDLKRKVALIIINLLKDSLSPDELKGTSRQMYKILRGR
jgi:hypothetical protein